MGFLCETGALLVTLEICSNLVAFATKSFIT
jgi:hypothetical protein